MARNFYNYIQQSYSGGQNDTDEKDQLRDDEGVLVKNSYIHKIGALEKRNGIATVGDDMGSAKITGLTHWQENDGTKWQLCVETTDLKWNNSGTWTDLDTGFTTGLDMEFAIANNKLYMCNGTENIHSWDGASTTADSCLTDLGTSIPKGKYLIWWKNYMFCCGESDLGGTLYPSRVWFSNLGDPDTWTTATDYFDVNTSDGQKITGIGVLEDYLVIFKENSIWVMTGGFPDDWKISSSNNNLTNVYQGIGCVSQRSIVQVGNDLWFMSKDGIRSLRRNMYGETPQMGLVSGDITSTIEGLNKGQLSKTAAILFEKRVYFALPNGSSTFNNLVMVADTRLRKDKENNPYAWVTYTGWNPACWDVYEPSSTAQLYFGEGDADGLIYQAETGTNDNTAAIDFDYKGRMIDLQAPDMRKTARFIWISGETGGDYDIGIYSSSDGNIYTYHGDFNLSAGVVWSSGVWDTSTWGYKEERREKFVLNRALKQVQIRFRNNAADEDIKIYPFTLAIKVKQVK